MKLKRGVWIAACLIGVVVFGGPAALLYAMILWGSEEGSRVPAGLIEWAVTLTLIAATCLSALFLAPREIDEATALEVDEDPAQWIKDMRNQSESNKQD